MEKLELFGNEELKTAVSSMINSGKISHSIVIAGEKGMGKKTAARYIGASLLCENNQGGKPCMKCRSCMMVSHGGHPDFIEVKPSGKSGGFILDKDLRPIISDSYVKPSEAKYRVLVIGDMDSTQQSSQNVLLKLVEEPPSHLVIIMTACSREYFLPTILSRVAKLKTTPLEKEELFEVVKENCENFDENELEKAFEAVGGNAGKCIEFLNGKTLSLAVDITELVCKACSEKDEYALMKAFSKAEGNRAVFKETLIFFSKALRDCAVKRSGGAELVMLSGCKEETSQLAMTISARKAVLLFELCESYITRVEGYANVNLALNSICAEIMEIL